MFNDRNILEKILAGIKCILSSNGDSGYLIDKLMTPRAGRNQRQTQKVSVGSLLA
jgi:hypothetical protein